MSDRSRDAGRHGRLAEALRRNLGRRKAQARAREGEPRPAEEPGPGPEAAGEAPPPDDPARPRDSRP